MNPITPQTSLVVVAIGDINKLDYVFEGVVVNSKVDHFVPLIAGGNSENPRVQLQPGTTRTEYTKLYTEQLRNIIEGYDILEGQEEPISFEDKKLIKHARTQSQKKVLVKGIFNRAW
jgi:hypothetical protein